MRTIEEFVKPIGMITSEKVREWSAKPRGMIRRVRRR